MRWSPAPVRLASSHWDEHGKEKNFHVADANAGAAGCRPQAAWRKALSLSLDYLRSCHSIFSRLMLQWLASWAWRAMCGQCQLPSVAAAGSGGPVRTGDAAHPFLLGLARLGASGSSVLSGAEQRGLA